MMVVCASRDLPPGTEVAFEYCSPDLDDYGVFRNRLEQVWGFECNCRMCEARSKTKESTQAKRKGLRENVLAAIEAGGIFRIDGALKDFKNTYTSSSLEVPRLQISILRFSFAKNASPSESPKKSCGIFSWIFVFTRFCVL